MSSYINYVFKYLFQADKLSAELSSGALGARAADAPGPQNGSNLSLALNCSAPSLGEAALADCLRRRQLLDYYNQYDIFVGLRIASTLTILFVVFILFVIYKTGCGQGEPYSRSQLQLATSARPNDSSSSTRLSSPASAARRPGSASLRR